MVVRFHSRRFEYTRLVMVALMSGLLGSTVTRLYDVRQISTCVDALEHAAHVVEDAIAQTKARR